MKVWISCVGALASGLLAPLAATAASLSLTGRVALPTATPVNEARITVTFYGHEMGIHEYTTRRRVRARTAAQGRFEALVKVPDDRYIWTHATLEISETDVSKAATAIARCEVDHQGGADCSKELRVNPLLHP